jgi:pSer/pThr/pTyr-binding forkhead associated (FHA) protein
MPYIQFNDQRFPLTAAELTVGAYDGAALRLPGDDANLRAVLLVGADGTAIVRRGHGDAIILVNGVQLGAEPSPLLHGDKLSLGVYDLRYGDDVKGGGTHFLSSVSAPESLMARGNTPKQATTATGGRLISLVDGREYPVPPGGVTFGREIGNDIVISSTEVSRKHAMIGPAETGYVVTDTSTNGMTVNGLRVEKSQLLARGDVLKIGPEEYRFYADVAKAVDVAPAAAVPAASAPPPVPLEAPALVAAGSYGLGGLDEMPLIDMEVVDLEDAIVAASSTPPRIAPKAEPRPAAPPPASVDAPMVVPTPGPIATASAAPPVITEVTAATVRKPLATLEVINEGPMKGTSFELFTPLANIGRGPHNDVALQDESVSDSHAKILRRDGAWWLADLASTNGSYVGGRRVQGEQQLAGAPDVRFGSVKMMFKPAQGSAETDGTGTRAIAAFSVDAARKAAEKKRATQLASQEPDTAKPPAKTKKGCMAMIAFLVTLGAAGASMMALLFTIRG